eukprot:2965549-Rhodomonas_salina.1
MQWEHQQDYSLATTTPQLLSYLDGKRPTKGSYWLVSPESNPTEWVWPMETAIGALKSREHQCAVTSVMAPPVSIPCPAVLDMGLEILVGMTWIIIEHTDQ